LEDRKFLATKVGQLLRGQDHNAGTEPVSIEEASDLATGDGAPGTKGWETSGARSDEYWTPAYALGPLLPYLPTNRVIWECAWGTGELARHLRAAGYRVVGRAGMDFLTWQPDQWDITVTNPPFSPKKKEAFLERAYSLGKPFAFLLPVAALGGSLGRFYRRHGIELLVPDKRVNFYNDSELPLGAAFPTAWFCWKVLPRQLVFVEADW
jgi:hypothetical protein